MNDQSLADLAREYGLDPADYEDMCVDDPIVDYAEYDIAGYGGYSDMEDYIEEPGNFLVLARRRCPQTAI